MRVVQVAQRGGWAARKGMRGPAALRVGWLGGREQRGCVCVWWVGGGHLGGAELRERGPVPCRVGCTGGQVQAWSKGIGAQRAISCRRVGRGEGGLRAGKCNAGM